MNVVEDDNMVRTILMDEYAHCHEMLEVLQKSIADCPKGKLCVREKVNKKSLKIYHYYSLKFREKNKVFNQHISESKLPEMQNLLEKRMKLIEETKPYKNRIRYIEKILGISRNKHSGKNITS